MNWRQLSGPVRYRTDDRAYQVHEIYTADGVRFRAIQCACLRATPIGEPRESAEAARDDAEAFAAKVMPC